MKALMHEGPEFSTRVEIWEGLFARGNEMEGQIDGQLGRLEVGVTHVQKSVDEVKEDQRALRKRLDEIGDKSDRANLESLKHVDGVRTELLRHVDDARKETSDARAEVSGRVNDTHREILVVRDELIKRTDEARKELLEVRESIASARLWALSLYIALAAGLLLVIARGFKWL